jgi:DNA-binding NarL/FixJ family response regulator
MLPPKPLSIIVADDHPSIRYGLVSALQGLEFIQQIHSASNGQEVLKLMEKMEYDIILMDIRMPVMNGVETTEAIIKENPNAKIIALSMFSEERYVLEMFNKGALGYLIKNADREAIIEAILTVNDGHYYVSKEIPQSVFNKVKDKENVTSKKKNHEQLLIEIIFLLSHDFITKEIADILNYGTRTIEDYRHEILKRLNVPGIAGVVNYANAHGIHDDVLLKSKFEKYLKNK